MMNLTRFCSQVVLTKDMENMDIQLPSATRNMFVDGRSTFRHRCQSDIDCIYFECREKAHTPLMSRPTAAFRNMLKKKEGNGKCTGRPPVSV
jgi:hypothetical protein